MASGTSEYTLNKNTGGSWDIVDTSNPPEGYGYIAVDANGVAETHSEYYVARKTVSRYNFLPAATREWTSP